MVHQCAILSRCSRAKAKLLFEIFGDRLRGAPRITSRRERIERHVAGAVKARIAVQHLGPAFRAGCGGCVVDAGMKRVRPGQPPALLEDPVAQRAGMKQCARSESCPSRASENSRAGSPRKLQTARRSSRRMAADRAARSTASGSLLPSRCRTERSRRSPFRTAASVTRSKVWPHGPAHVKTVSAGLCARARAPTAAAEAAAAERPCQHQACHPSRSRICSAFSGTFPRKSRCERPARYAG